MQFETAGAGCSLHHIAQTRLPYQTGGGLVSDTGGEHESQIVDKQCRERGPLGGWATRKLLRMRERTTATFSCQAFFLTKRCRSRVYPTHEKPSSFFAICRHTPQRSVVHGSMTSWKTEGQDQMLLLLDDTLIHDFRAACNCLARKQQVSRQRIERLSGPRGGVNRAPAMRRSLMSRRRLTRYDRWRAKLV